MTFKMRRRKNSMRLRGHRQGYTEIEITGIVAS
jgi:ribosomal protein L21